MPHVRVWPPYPPPPPPPSPHRLLENQQIFKAADEIVSTSIARLDADIASLTNAALQKFMSLQAKHAHALLGIYTQSLDSIGVPAAAAAAVAAPELEGGAEEVAAEQTSASDEGAEGAAPAATAPAAEEEGAAPAAAAEEQGEGEGEKAE